VGVGSGTCLRGRASLLVAATVHDAQGRGLSNVEPKQQIILTSTRSRHPSFDGDCALSPRTPVASRQRLRWGHHLVSWTVADAQAQPPEAPSRARKPLMPVHCHDSVAQPREGTLQLIRRSREIILGGVLRRNQRRVDDVASVDGKP
jgi:hypothetical protein